MHKGENVLCPDHYRFHVCADYTKLTLGTCNVYGISVCHCELHRTYRKLGEVVGQVFSNEK